MAAGHSNDPVAVPLAYGARKRRERALRRERSSARAKTSVDLAAVPDPLLREGSDGARVAGAAWWVTVALALHGAVVLAALAIPEHGDARATQAYLEPVVVQIVEPPHVELPSPVAPPLEVKTAEPVRPVPPVVKPPVETKTLPPPDPIDPTPPPTADPPKEPPRRIVGLSLESTTTGGAGEAFAAGNTRMGQTSLVAEDPSKVEKLQHTFTPPRRTSVYVPPYPASLRGRGIRGEVGVEVEIDATGHVTRVSVTRASTHDEFNALAADAARRSTYEPAKVDGVAVVRSIDITVQFQPND
jgi:protein TonB